VKRRPGRPQNPLPLISQKPGPYFLLRAFCDFLNAKSHEERVRLLYRAHLGIPANYEAKRINESRGKKWSRTKDRGRRVITVKPPLAWFFRRIPAAKLEEVRLEQMWSEADFETEMVWWVEAYYSNARKTSLRRHLSTRQRQFRDLFDAIIENENPYLVARRIERWVSKTSMFVWDGEKGVFEEKTGPVSNNAEPGLVPILDELKQLLMNKGSAGIGRCANPHCNRYLIRIRKGAREVCCRACRLRMKNS